MSDLLTTIKHLFVKQDVETKAIVGTDWIGRVNPISRASVTVANNASATYLGHNDAQLSTIFYTILTSIQNTAKSIPWSVYALSDADENAKKLPNHQLSKLLYRPNPKQSYSDFVVQCLAHLFCEGNLYIYIIRNETGLNKGEPVQMWVMPISTEVLPGAGWMSDVQGYRVPKMNGGYDSFKASDVLHIKKFKLGDTVYGLSPIQAGILPLTSVDYAMKQRIKQLANGGPKVIVYLDEPETETEGLTPDQEKAFVRKLTKSGDVEFSNSKIGVANVGLSAVDLDILNAVQADSGMVADLLGYPSILLSGNKSSTYNNVSEAQKALYTNCIIPALNDIRDGLNFALGDAFKDNAYIDMDLSGIEVLKPNLASLITAAAGADFMTVNEKRKMVQLPSIEGGDGFVRSAGLQYFTSIDEADTATADAYDAGDADVTDN